MTPIQRISLFAVFALFLTLRLPALDQIYHQDEAKWACYVDPVVQANYPEECKPGTIPHPPLGEYLFWLGGAIAGYNHLRVVPLLFAILNFWLLFAIARRRWGPRAAIAACFLTSVTFYSVLASVQIDTDGAILPFWALLAWWAYDRGMDQGSTGGWALFILAAAGGMATKVSFVLALAAFGLDALCALGWRVLWERRLRLLGLAAGIAVATVVFFSLLQFVLYPHGEPLRFIWYADKFPFLNLASRPWGDIVFQVLKALCYFGPLIPCLAGLTIVGQSRAGDCPRPDLVPGQGEGRPQGPALHDLRGAAVPPAAFRLPLLFLGVHAAFYLVLFDFSGRPLERYLEFAIAPMAMIAGGMANSVLTLERKRWSAALIDALLPAGVVILLIVATFGAALDPIPLYPKSILIGRLRAREFGFLIPFTGGSGPLGFYIPAALVIGVWTIAAAGLLLERLTHGGGRAMTLGLMVAAGLGSSATFAEEYLLGIRYGHMSRLAAHAIRRCAQEPSSGVVTYNDVGLYELRRAGRYAGRFYARPEFWRENEAKLTSVLGGSSILVFEFPLMDAKGPYCHYFMAAGRRRVNLTETTWLEYYVGGDVWWCLPCPNR